MPVECFSVRLEVHQSPGARVWCYSIEVADPHTRELLAKVVQPARRYSEVLGLVSLVTTDVRGLLLELTDPDPF